MILEFIIGTFSLTVLFLIMVVIFFKYKFTYWRRRGFVYVEPVIPFGNGQKFIFKETSVGELSTELYNDIKNKKKSKFGGCFIFQKPLIMVVDLDLIRDILTKNFDHFHDRITHFHDEIDPLSSQLATLPGARWRKLRAKVSPFFTSLKIKGMVQLLANISECFEDVLNVPSKNGVPFDMSDVMARYTTDTISTCAFGLDTNSLKNPDSEFRHYGKLFLEPSLRQFIVDIANVVFPQILVLFRIPTIQKQISEFFTESLRQTIQFRENNGIERGDFLNLLTNALKNPSEEKSITFMELVAQSFMFFVAGFETSSTTLTCCMYELAVNQDIQDKLREEVLSVLKTHNNEITYDAIQDLKYMDQVIDEALRKYPPIPVINRLCTRDYIIPGTDRKLIKGDNILISILAIHRDPDLYPEPDRFDPERFSSSEKSKRHPMSHIPFSDGPRYCIGFRFASLQVKIGLLKLLSKYKFKLHSTTKYPMDFKKSGAFLKPSGPIMMTCKNIC